jgi:hypothetical protein
MWKLLKVKWPKYTKSIINVRSNQIKSNQILRHSLQNSQWNSPIIMIHQSSFEFWLFNHLSLFWYIFVLRFWQFSPHILYEFKKKLDNFVFYRMEYITLDFGKTLLEMRIYTCRAQKVPPGNDWNCLSQRKSHFLRYLYCISKFNYLRTFPYSNFQRIFVLGFCMWF